MTRVDKSKDGIIGPEPKATPDPAMVAHLKNNPAFEGPVVEIESIELIPKSPTKAEIDADLAKMQPDSKLKPVKKETKEPELEEFKVVELRAIAKADGAEIKSNMRKPDLIEAIRKARK